MASLRNQNIDIDIGESVKFSELRIRRANSDMGWKYACLNHLWEKQMGIQEMRTELWVEYSIIFNDRSVMICL